MPYDQAIPGDVAAIIDPQELTAQDAIFVVEDTVERAELLGAVRPFWMPTEAVPWMYFQMLTSRLSTKLCV